MMMTCAQCFDNHMRAELLAETCQVRGFREGTPGNERIRLVFTCLHNRDHAHLSYPRSADWPFALAKFQATVSNSIPAAA
jgi:hypothetical protein